jgi:riboflavin biosynthesis pyrimidine reductase
MRMRTRRRRSRSKRRREGRGAKFGIGPAARAQGHLLRAKSQAILVGSRTAIVDKPLLTVRDVPGVEVYKTYYYTIYLNRY